MAQLSREAGPVVHPACSAAEAGGLDRAADLRSMPEVANVGGAPVKKALFVTGDDVPVRGMAQIASDPEETLAANVRNQIGGAFKASRVSATKLHDILWELLTQKSDPDWVTACRPLMPRRDGRMNLYLGVKVRTARIGPGMAEWPLIVEVCQRNYRQMASANVTLASKYLATLTAKYQLDDRAESWEQFIPADLPKRPPVKPATTYTEAFTGTGATLGGATLTWNELGYTWANASDRGNGTGAGYALLWARAEHDLSTDDMRVQVQHYPHSGSDSYAGVTARHSASVADTGYALICHPSLNDYYGQRYAAGAATDIITSELSGSQPKPS